MMLLALNRKIKNGSIKTHYMLESVISLDLTGPLDPNLTGRQLPFPTVPSCTLRILAKAHISMSLPGQLPSDAIRVRVFTSSNRDGHVFRVIPSIWSHLRSANQALRWRRTVVANDEQHLALKAVQTWSIGPSMHCVAVYRAEV